MLIGVKSKKGSLFSMRLCDAINIQLIFPPQGAFVPLSFDFRLFNRRTLSYSVSLSPTDFPLCAPQIRQGGYFCFAFFVVVVVVFPNSK